MAFNLIQNTGQTKINKSMNVTLILKTNQLHKAGNGTTTSYGTHAAFAVTSHVAAASVV